MEEIFEDQFEIKYKLFEYFDNLEEATRFAKDRGFSKSLIEKLEIIHDNMIELEPLLKTDENYYQLQEGVEKFITIDLYNACKNGDEEKAAEVTEQIYKGLKELNFNLGFEKAKELINNNPFSMIATADAKGRVNVAFVGSATILDERRLSIVQMLLHNTVKNLKENKNAVIVGFRINNEKPMETEMARVYCTLEEELEEGEFFERIKERATSEAGGGAKIREMISKAFIFRIDDIRIFGVKEEM